MPMNDRAPTLSSYVELPAKNICPDTLYLVGIVTLISGFQLGNLFTFSSSPVLHLSAHLQLRLATTSAFFGLASFAKRVGIARRKYKITPPATDGEEGFVRIFRAQ